MTWSATVGQLIQDQIQTSEVSGRDYLPFAKLSSRRSASCDRMHDMIFAHVSFCTGTGTCHTFVCPSPTRLAILLAHRTYPQIAGVPNDHGGLSGLRRDAEDVGRGVWGAICGTLQVCSMSVKDKTERQYSDEMS
jgi:hypothetical protein